MRSKHKKKFLIIAGTMLVGAISFLVYALNNPQASFPWNNEISYVIYILYFLGMCTMFIIGKRWCLNTVNPF